jgi:hypothetical protein
MLSGYHDTHQSARYEVGIMIPTRVISGLWITVYRFMPSHTEKNKKIIGLKEQGMVNYF